MRLNAFIHFGLVLSANFIVNCQMHDRRIHFPGIFLCHRRQLRIYLIEKFVFLTNDGLAFVFLSFWRKLFFQSTMSDHDLAKQIISTGQKKEFDRLQEIVSDCDTKLVCFFQQIVLLRAGTIYILIFGIISVGENGR